MDLLRVISHHGARLATPIRTMQKLYSDADSDNVPFADSIYSRGGVAPHRPLLLIEPSYRINGEDKTRSQTKTTKSDAKSDSKVGATQKPDIKADARVAETNSSGTTDESNSEAGSTSDPKTADKVTAKTTSKSVPKMNPKATEVVPGSESRVGSASDNLNKEKKTVEGKKPTTPNQGNVTQEGKFNNPSVSLSETSVDKTGESNELKQEGDKMPASKAPVSRPAMEENLVLGVALEGSKRTLPIEEDITPPAEGKELATASRNGNGNSSTKANKDKDGQNPSTKPSSASGGSDVD